MQRIAFTGSTRPEGLPHDWVGLFLQAACHFAQRGYTLQTCGSTGADRMAAEAALREGGAVHLFRPWEAFERDWVSRMRSTYPGQLEDTVFEAVHHSTWIDAVRNWHPTARYLAPAAVKLQGTNFGMMTGVSQAVVLPFARAARPAGSTRDPQQRESAGPVDKGSCTLALRVAEELGIPCLDLSEPQHRLALRQRLHDAFATAAPG